MSLFTIYPEYADAIVERWKRVTVCAVAGTRLSPDNPALRLSFITQSDKDLIGSSVAFDYETDIIELYSAKECQLFRIMNKNAIEKGLLIPFSGTANDLNTANALSDKEIESLITLHHAKFKKELTAITSEHTLKRIQSRLTDKHAQAYHKAVSEALDVTLQPIT